MPCPGIALFVAFVLLWSGFATSELPPASASSPLHAHAAEAVDAPAATPGAARQRHGVRAIDLPSDANLARIAASDHARFPVTQGSLGSWPLDGHIPMPELKDRLVLDRLPEADLGRYRTLSGMMRLLTGRPPKVADTLNGAGRHVEIVERGGKTIHQVLACRLPDAAPVAAAGAVDAV